VIDKIVFSSLKVHSYVGVTLQQTRGLYDSGPPAQRCPPACFDNANHTKSDAGVTGKFIGKQNWSNGVVMTQGASAMGMMALLAAGATPPIVTRASWLFVTTNNVREAFYRGGAFMSAIFDAILLPGFLPPDQVDRAPLALHEGDGPDPFWDPVRFDDWGKVQLELRVYSPSHSARPHPRARLPTAAAFAHAARKLARPDCLAS
jgi:hypothetical protein